MSLLTTLPPTVDTRRPVLSRATATLAIVVALFTLLCVVMAMTVHSAAPLAGAGAVIVAAIAASLYRPEPEALV
ncbi:hypothetical protein [Mobilicoccus massiliensis]|uniref:hypothetical protein n=1 Tax=Mobilicoccus massiliensis TaxID=1522310 RepID=UPI00058DB3E5|nr:hypothetical protein [Mobilicoccus massiliensis]